MYFVSDLNLRIRIMVSYIDNYTNVNKRLDFSIGIIWKKVKNIVEDKLICICIIVGRIDLIILLFI